MGIVRDVTVDQLTQAVGNIDTSTLAQDSTLQDVVTAISNISGGSDPVTNTTVNSLCKDSTGQDIKDSLDDIKSAVQGLGTALGSDRALIDGSNIGSPATFRQNIGLTTKSGNITALNNFTLSEVKVKQYGNVVYVGFTATKSSAIGSNNIDVGVITGVNIPNNYVRFSALSGTITYATTNPVYGLVDYRDGKINIKLNNSADTIVNVSVSYIVD